MSAKSRSCKEFIEKYADARVSCATCSRWLPQKQKCREELWVGEWVTAEYEESKGFAEFNKMIRENKGVHLG